jgi:hypothetical protein
MARARTVEPHRVHEGCSRCSAARAALLDDPQMLHRKETCGSPVDPVADVDAEVGTEVDTDVDK